MEGKNMTEVLCANNPVKLTKNNTDGPAQLKTKLYAKRWLLLCLFIFYSGSSACQWIQYSIITNIVTRYYGVSSVAVDWTAMTFMAYFVALVFPATYMADRWGLRWTILIGSSINCVGAWVKVFSVYPEGFYVTFIGQSLVALAQTSIVALPGRLAAQWFGPDELSTATSLGIFGAQLGISLGFLITPMVVKNHENLENIGNDLSYLFWGVAILTTIALVLVVILFQDDPKIPPSKTRALQKLNRSKEQNNFLETVKRLFKNKCYMMLCNTYGLNIGVLNVVSTLLNQIYLIRFENGEEDAGRIGLAMIVAGMLGSVTFGIILDRTHKFKETTVAVYFLSFCGQVLFGVFTCYGIRWMVYLSATFLGFFMSGYLALGYEMCAEYTYPESESIAAGILNIANSAYGVILVLLLGKVLESYGDIPVHIGVCTALFVGLILTALTKDEQRRQAARKSAQYEGVSTIDKNDEEINHGN